MGDVRVTRVYEEQPETVKRRILVSRTCDWCGMEMGERYGQEAKGYGERELMISFLQGKAYPPDPYPQGGYLTGWEVPDLCDDCVAKLRAALEELGIKVQDAEREW